MMQRTLVDAQGEVHRGIGRPEVERRLAAGEFFWLDLPALGAEELSWMREVFHFHPLAIEDSEHFRQRPKLEEYDGYVFLVLYGSGTTLAASDLDSGPAAAEPADVENVSEIHCFLSAQYLITVHRCDCPAFTGLVARIQARRQVGEAPTQLFYQMADTLVDSFFPVLSALDDHIDALQAQIFARPTNDQLAQLLDYKSSLIVLRRVITPERDLFAALASGADTLPGFTDESQRYFRDTYDHLIRLSDMVDSYRDLLSSTTDAYLSVVSNQLNLVTKQLTIIATIFLPLSFLTGFFGQNFAWMVTRITSLGSFLIFAVGTELVAVAFLFTLFRRRGWLGSG
jgi:magnesium transporter